jgi:hypothetical protein
MDKVRAPQQIERRIYGHRWESHGWSRRAAAACPTAS